jgi:HEPN domain-containing protein
MNAEEGKAKLTKDWLISAADDLNAVSRLMQPPPLTNLAAFHCQPSIEKALKGYLMWNDVPSRKTHNLVELVRQCCEVDPSFRELRSMAESLTPYATESRYPDTEFVLDHEALIEARRMASESLQFVINRLPPDVHPH